MPVRFAPCPQAFRSLCYSSIETQYHTRRLSVRMQLCYLAEDTASLPRSATRQGLFLKTRSLSNLDVRLCSVGREPETVKIGRERISAG